MDYFVILLMGTFANERDTCLESMYKFRQAVIALFGEDYLRGPNVPDNCSAVIDQ
jgi:hypothetical protein